MPIYGQYSLVARLPARLAHRSAASAESRSGWVIVEGITELTRPAVHEN